MICKNCGKENDFSAMFCSACGTSLSETAQPRHKPPSQTPSQTVQPPVQMNQSVQQPHYQYQTYQQPQYNQTCQPPQNTMPYNSNLYAKNGSSKLGIRVFVAILSVLISLMMFCPMLSFKASLFSSTYAKSPSLIGLLNEAIDATKGYNNSSAKEMVTSLSFIVAAIAISTLFVLIFSLAKRSKGCQATALIFSIVHCIVALFLISYISSETPTFSLGFASLKIGWGAILMVLFSILEVIFAAVAIAGTSSPAGYSPAPAPYYSNIPQQPTQNPAPPQNSSYQQSQTNYNQNRPHQ